MNGMAIVFWFYFLLHVPAEPISCLTVLLRYILLRRRHTKTLHINNARFFNIGILTLDQELTIFIVSKIEYAQCMCSRPVKLKSTSRVSLYEWCASFVSFDFIVR